MTRRRKSTSKDPQAPLPQGIKDALLGEKLLKFARQVRSGAGPIRWPENTSTTVRGALEPWLRTGDVVPLLRLLETLPWALSHPVVFHFVQRLYHLSCQRELEEIGQSPWLDDEPEPLPPGTSFAAARVLEQVAGAVVSGLFHQPGWRVLPPAKSGRPKRGLTEIIDAQGILRDYESVLSYLQDRKVEFKRKKGELEDRRVLRLSKLITTAWIESGIGVEIGSTSSKSGQPLDGDIIRTPLPFPDDVARKVAQEGPALDAIAYALVGYRWHIEPRSVRHHVEIARK